MKPLFLFSFLACFSWGKNIFIFYKACCLHYFPDVFYLLNITFNTSVNFIWYRLLVVWFPYNLHLHLDLPNFVKCMHNDSLNFGHKCSIISVTVTASKDIHLQSRYRFLKAREMQMRLKKREDPRGFVWQDQHCTYYISKWILQLYLSK